MNFIRLRVGNRMHQHKDRTGKLTHPQGFTWEISQTRWNWRVQIDVSLNTSLWCMRTNFKSEIWTDGNFQHAHRKRHHEIQKQKNILATFRNGDLLNSGNVYIKEHQNCEYWRNLNRSLVNSTVRTHAPPAEATTAVWEGGDASSVNWSPGDTHRNTHGSLRKTLRTTWKADSTSHFATSPRHPNDDIVYL